MSDSTCKIFYKPKKGYTIYKGYKSPSGGKYFINGDTYRKESKKFIFPYKLNKTDIVKNLK